MSTAVGRRPPEADVVEAAVKDLMFRLGVIISLIALLIVFASADNGYCGLEAEPAVTARKALNCAEYWLNRYQSLLGALATLAAAFLAFYAVQRQIAQNDRLDLERRAREAEAARAVLPLTLSMISTYAMKCIEIMRDEIPHGPPLTTPRSIEFPSFPDDVVRTLQDNIRHEQPGTARQIADLIKNAQIQNSRLSQLHLDLPTINTNDYKMLRLQQGLFDACSLYARASQLFDHARGDFSRFGISFTEFYNAAAIGGLDLNALPILKNLFERAAQVPPNWKEGL